MIRKLLSITLLAHAALAEVQADLSYTGKNDRYDLTEMVSARNKMFRDTPQVDDKEYGGVAPDGDYRRHLRNKDIHPPRVLTRREDIDFAYDPDNLPSIGRAGDDNMLDLEYQENLKQFKMSIPQSSRRKVLTDEQKHEDEVLMQNVVPITMIVDGYLKTPLQELASLYVKQGKRLIIETD